MLKNGLYIVATPIGNLNDITLRALDVLKNADVIACEDTRVSKKLFTLLGISTDKKFICYEDHREDKVASKIVEMIESGLSVALISDAGSPLISDPGYKLVKLCRAQNLSVTTIPGASAVISALQISGLPTNRFMFAGFIPNKQKARADLFSELKNINATLVFYETAPRLTDTLNAMSEPFEGREIAVAREITKIYEECRTGTAQELCTYYKETPPKGEIVLMIAPPNANDTQVDIASELQKRLKTMSVKDAVQEVSLLSGAKKSDVYDLALRLKNE